MGKLSTRHGSQLHPLLPSTRDQHHRMLTLDVEASSGAQSPSTSPSSPTFSYPSPSAPYTSASSPRSASPRFGTSSTTTTTGYAHAHGYGYGHLPKWSERLASLPKSSSLVAKSRETILRPWRIPRWRGGLLGILCLVFLWGGWPTFRLSLDRDDLESGYGPSFQDDRWFISANGVDPSEEDTIDGEYTKPSLQSLKEAVGEDPKFFTKNGVAWYGFNNRRYMLEATMNLARITHRIPILPSHIWARSCVVESEECTKHALQYLADRKNAPVFRDEFITWNEDGEAWKLGIEHFIDLPHLRRTYGLFLTQQEFFSLYASTLPSNFKVDPRGYWDPDLYTPKGMTCTGLNATDYYDSSAYVRIDREAQASGGGKGRGKTWGRQGRGGIEGIDERVVRELMKDDHTFVWTMEKAVKALKSKGIGSGKELRNEEWAKALVRQGSLREVFTFDDSVLMCKAMARPSTEYVDSSHLRPFQTEAFERYSNASILAILGQIHDQRKPGAAHFSSPFARDQFMDWVIEGIRPPRAYVLAAEKVVEEITRRTQGRLWGSAHLRRGDFVGIAWASEKDPKTHFDKVKKALEAGIDVLRNRPSTIPGQGRVQPIRQQDLPLSNDVFYLATDEDDPVALAYYRRKGALLLHDLIKQDELDELLGWRAKYWDLLALVEQEVLAQSDYFVGSRMSSTTGGAINSRLRRRRKKEEGLAEPKGVGSGSGSGLGHSGYVKDDEDWIFLEEFVEREREHD
ncbi:BQ2448_7172 [Microbotryum intermedium]|uniref:BQ2448_7172 protein n=1 Tax=Microbotryum intermedium TaxID=269621 RepID=A0A238FJ28_9BASI|nr:BQ2448_7172 [Microbotryum intermedium]